MLLEMQHISKTYPHPMGGRGREVLHEASLKLAAGDSLAVVGPSGSGKSTLLNIIGGLDRPTRGTVQLGGRNLAEMSDHDLAEMRCTDIGFIFQFHHLLPQCTVLENVLVPTIPAAARATPEQARERALQLIDRVGLGERIEHRPGQLSGGECQRVAVVRALINRPALLLGDEPTGSLDSSNAAELGALLEDLRSDEGFGLIVVTHSSELAAAMDTTLRLADGRLEPKAS